MHINQLERTNMFEDIHLVGKDTHIIETMIIERGHTQSICLEPAKVYTTDPFSH